MEYDFSVDKLKEGLILPFDKPFGWTSFKLVNKVRYQLCRHGGIKKLKVGHAGTLDPLATGLLILCTGKATKRISEIQEMPKVYEAKITFGATTPSYDMETEIDKTFPVEHITEELLSQKINGFLGKSDQVPPLFSAKNINGVRAYKYAREGIEKKLRPQEIEIFSFTIIDFTKPMLKVRIQCSKGTYIRSIARDLGLAVDSGAYLSGLVRSEIGNYTLEKAIDIEKFERKLNIL